MNAPRTAAVLLLGALLLGTSGCNDGPAGRAASPDRPESDDSDARASEARPDPSPSASPAPVDPADASAAAAAINLTRRDLPTFTTTAQDGASVATAPEQALARCLELPEPGPVLRSDGFLRGPQDAALLVSSAVEVVQDPEAAAAVVEALDSDGAAACVGDFAEAALTQLAGDSGVRFSPPDVTRLQPDAGSGYRVTTTSTDRDDPLRFTVDVLRFAEERTGVSLYVVGVGDAMPEEQRDALQATLVERTRQHAL